jgi:hypothetical protein
VSVPWCHRPSTATTATATAAAAATTTTGIVHVPQRFLCGGTSSKPWHPLQSCGKT